MEMFTHCHVSSQVNSLLIVVVVVVVWSQSLIVASTMNIEKENNNNIKDMLHKFLWTESMLPYIL